MRISSLPALMSRPARGAWVEIHRSVTRSCAAGRAPQGARGLKYHSTHHLHRIHQSRPARGAWVEIRTASTMTQRFPRSRPARGAWVEMKELRGIIREHLSRAPQGARGLKFECTEYPAGSDSSRPARGAWVEILFQQGQTLPRSSRPARGAWVEISSALHPRPPEHQSRPARGAWVEI